MKILELFGGIGACTKALKRLGLNPTTVDYVEIDKYAVASYNAINGTNFEPQDICQWDKNIEVDLIMHGSPCQDFSVAGLQAGGDENSGTRSSLMYESVRIITKLKPKYVVWENVKNVLSAKHKHNFDKYLNALTDLGYQNFYQVLNAKDYGVPQNRERVFVVSILGGGKFEFPEKQELRLRLKDVLQNEVDEKFYVSTERLNKIQNSTFMQERKMIQEKDVCDTLLARDYKDPKCVRIGNIYGENFGTGYAGNVWDKEALSPTLVTCTGGGRQPHIIDDTYKNRAERIYEEYSPSLRAERSGLKVAESMRIRKLTPLECWRLMGFDDEDFYKAEAVNSNTQLYKQAGNSIVVNVLEAIFRNLLTEGEN